MSRKRVERDSVGELELPLDVYYGVQSLRAKINFPITGQSLRKEQIEGLALIKQAAAQTNLKFARLDQKKAEAIEKTCQEILAGKLHEAFITDPIQGGAGTSANMNANEVIANRAGELLGAELGSYAEVHPNDHVNLGQSTNDVYPTSGKIAALKLLDTALPKLEDLAKALAQKAEEFDDVIKVGRTQLQDAVPIRLGQEFAAYAKAVRRGIEQIKTAREGIYTINMGATAIGTGITASKEYLEEIVPTLAKLSGYPFVQADDLVDGTQHIDVFVDLSAALKQCSIALSKCANDLRLMSMGPRAGLGEIHLPARQNGSSIMPGKINPVLPEVVSQVCYAICGNDMTITMAAEGGQLELNPFEPVLFYKLFESIEALGNVAETFRIHCVEGITANRERCQYLLDNSLATITALAPIIGYTHTAAIAEEAMAKGETIAEILAEQKDLEHLNFEEIMDARKLTEPFAD
ncbi:MAG: aspartate ammonia-lyase [Eubacteriales bacterium]|nr:aspartate ammonia-lyase [Eubacteriales bacterium]